jgi:hypothetical protein
VRGQRHESASDVRLPGVPALGCRCSPPKSWCAPSTSRGGDNQDRLYDARMEDAGELTFQARTDPKLVKALLRRSLLPIALGVGAATLAIAALLYGAGNPGGWALPILGGGVFAMSFVLFMLPQQVVTRDAHKIGGPVAYRIDAAGVHTVHGFSANTLPWSAIKAVRRARGQILLPHHGLSGSKLRMSSIPTADLTAAEQARLLAVLRSRGAALTRTPTI